MKKKNRKRLIGKLAYSFPIFIIIVLTSFSAIAQKNEVGLGLGGLSYTGDINRTYQILDNRPAGLIYYRTNLNRLISLRYGVTLGKLQASDINSVDNFGIERNASFNIFLIEPSVSFEYNFLDYLAPNTLINFSPYFFGGAGFFTFFGQQESTESYSSFQPVIPFGIGLKYKLSRNWRFNFEFGARKTFFDHLDNVSAGLPNTKNLQYGNPNDKDTYYFVGISIGYVFYNVLCPYDFY